MFSIKYNNLFSSEKNIINLLIFSNKVELSDTKHNCNLNLTYLKKTQVL